MFKPRLILLFLGCFLTSISCQLVSSTQLDSTGPAAALHQTCRASVDGIDALWAGLTMPTHFSEQDILRQPGDFDVNEYFTALDHLSLQPGYALDYLYYKTGMGGEPVLFAYPEGEPPYQTHAELLAAVQAANPTQEYASVLDLNREYLAAIEADESPAGYLQLSILALLGDQFYLDWHANYDDDIILCDAADLDRVKADIDSFGIDIAQPDYRKARQLDFTPTVTIDEETVTVHLVTFTKWGGFFDTTLTFDRQFPHLLREEIHENLIPYDCGIMF